MSEEKQGVNNGKKKITKKEKIIISVCVILGILLTILLIVFNSNKNNDYYADDITNNIYQLTDLGTNVGGNAGYFYNQDSLSLNEVSDDILVELAIRNLDKDEKYSDLKYTKDDFIINDEFIKEKTMELFGRSAKSDKRIELNNHVCTHGNNSYKCEYFVDETDGGIFKYVKNLDNSYKKDNQFIIEETVYYFEAILDENDYSKYNVTLYDNDIGLYDGSNINKNDKVIARYTDKVSEDINLNKYYYGDKDKLKNNRYRFIYELNENYEYRFVRVERIKDDVSNKIEGNYKLLEKGKQTKISRNEQYKFSANDIENTVKITKDYKNDKLMKIIIGNNEYEYNINGSSDIINFNVIYNDNILVLSISNDYTYYDYFAFDLKGNRLFSTIDNKINNIDYEVRPSEAYLKEDKLVIKYYSVLDSKIKLNDGTIINYPYDYSNVNIPEKYHNILYSFSYEIKFNKNKITDKKVINKYTIKDDLEKYCFNKTAETKNNKVLNINKCSGDLCKFTYNAQGKNRNVSLKKIKKQDYGAEYKDFYDEYVLTLNGKTHKLDGGSSVNMVYNDNIIIVGTYGDMFITPYWIFDINGNLLYHVDDTNYPKDVDYKLYPYSVSLKNNNVEILYRINYESGIEFKDGLNKYELKDLPKKYLDDYTEYKYQMTYSNGKLSKPKIIDKYNKIENYVNEILYKLI